VKFDTSSRYYHSLSTRYIEFDHESVYDYLRASGIAFLGISASLPSVIGNTLGRAHDDLSRRGVKYISLPECIMFTQQLAQSHHSSVVNAKKLPSQTPLLRAAVIQWLDQAALAKQNRVPQQSLLSLTD